MPLLVCWRVQFPVAVLESNPSRWKLRNDVDRSGKSNNWLLQSSLSEESCWMKPCRPRVFSSVGMLIGNRCNKNATMQQRTNNNKKLLFQFPHMQLNKETMITLWMSSFLTRIAAPSFVDAQLGRVPSSSLARIRPERAELSKFFFININFLNFLVLVDLCPQLSWIAPFSMVSQWCRVLRSVSFGIEGWPTKKCHFWWQI